MKKTRAPIFFSFFAFCAACSDFSCMEQYNPRPFWQLLENEQKQAHLVKEELNDDGSLKKMHVVNEEEEELKSEQIATKTVENNEYNMYCALCHAQDGKGQTPAGQALKPQPRDFTTKSWQESVSDEHIYKVIKEGGAAVGLSPLMVPWGAVLDDKKIKQLIKKLRSFSR